MKKILSMLLVATMIIGIFTGCGSSGKKDYTLSEYLGTGTTIWYETYGTSKDSSINRVFVLESNGALYYADSNWTLEDVVEKDKEKIVKIVKEKYVESITKRIERAQISEEEIQEHIEYMERFIIESMIGELMDVEGYEYPEYGSFSGIILDRQPYLSTFVNSALNEAMATYTDEFFYYVELAKDGIHLNLDNLFNTQDDSFRHLITPIAEKYVQQYAEGYNAKLELEYEQYNVDAGDSYILNINSDSTGNETETETLHYQGSVPVSDGYEGYFCDEDSIELKHIIPYESDNGTTNCFAVYDKWFGGYSVGNDKYFLTQTDTPLIFQLDEVGTENVYVDKEYGEIFKEEGFTISE